jgi:hypothetical protein
MVRYDKREYKDIMARFVKSMIEDDRKGIVRRGGLSDFAEVQGVEALGNFANGDVGDGLDGGGVDNRDGAGAGVGNVHARAVGGDGDPIRDSKPPGRMRYRRRFD